MDFIEKIELTYAHSATEPISTNNYFTKFLIGYFNKFFELYHAIQIVW